MLLGLAVVLGSGGRQGFGAAVAPAPASEAGAEFGAAASDEVETPAQPLVFLTGHRARAGRRRGESTLTVDLTVRNTLPAGVVGLEIGVIFARHAEALRGIDPAERYARGTHVGQDGVGVVIEAVEVDLKAEAAGVGRLMAVLPDDAPEPVVFATHLLGYRLAAVNAPLLLRLLSTHAPADEAAAVATFGLLGGALGRAEARARWQRDVALVDGLADTLGLPIPDQLTQDAAFARVYAVLAFGTLGGPTAIETLQDLLVQSDLPRLDEPLQVLRVSRVVGSLVETPLGFALPADVRTGEDLVRTALAWALGTTDAPAQQGAGDGPSSGRPASAPPPDEGEAAMAAADDRGVASGHAPSAWWWLGAVGAAAAVGVAALVARRVLRGLTRLRKPIR